MPKKMRFSLTIPNESKKQIERVSFKNNITETQVIKDGLKKWCEENKDKLKENSTECFRTMNIEIDEEAREYLDKFISYMVDEMLKGVE